MSMNMDLEALAARYDFADLQPDERHAVLAELGSEDAYDGMREIILRSRASLAPADDDPRPRPDSHVALRAALKERHAARSSWSIERLLTYRVPIYQPTLLALAAIVVILAWRGFDEREIAAVAGERVVYVPVHDTVVRTAGYEEREIDEELIAQRVVDSLMRELERRGRERGGSVRSRSARREPIGETRPDFADAADTGRGVAASNRYVGLDNLPRLQSQRRGKTLAEDSGATRFSTPVGYYRN